ncbi:MAG: hypothetical protein ACFFDD_02470 [Promethearchaeota archaeon]
MSRVYVVDAGVLFSTWTMKVPYAHLITTNNIMVEVRNKPSKLRTEILLVLDRMQIIDPDVEYIQQTEKSATLSGDKANLSDNDLELVALALMLKAEGENVILVSMDFAVLNTASHLNISFLDPSGRFEHEITWVMSCPACQYRSKTPSRDTDCPICGTTMKRTSLRKRKKT